MITGKNLNLFNFATSELSQDAFLCWVAALALHDDVELQLLGRGFVAWLWERATGGQVDPANVQLLECPRRQQYNIDVTLEVVVDGTRARIIIEDKTESSQHGGQLERYRKLATADGVMVIPIYFKTGYHFGADVAARAAGYAVIGLSEWVSFLNAQAQRNDILDDYRNYVRGVLSSRDAALAQLMTPSGFNQLEDSFVQYDFLGKLADRCHQTIGVSAIRRGTNIGGDPWTHYRFAQYPAVLPGSVDEALFHRIDERKDNGGRQRYYLSTRQYSNVKDKPEAKLAKLARLKNYRLALDAAIMEAGAELVFAKPTTDNQGANESEIGVLFFDDSSNTTSRVLEFFPSVHQAFAARIASGLPG